MHQRENKDTDDLCAMEAIEEAGLRTDGKNISVVVAGTSKNKKTSLVMIVHVTVHTQRCDVS